MNSVKQRSQFFIVFVYIRIIQINIVYRLDNGPCHPIRNEHAKHYQHCHGYYNHAKCVKEQSQLGVVAGGNSDDVSVSCFLRIISCILRQCIGSSRRFAYTFCESLLDFFTFHVVFH